MTQPGLYPDLGSLTSVFECCICVTAYEPNRTPKILQCGHTFCEECLHRISNYGRICCPECRASTIQEPRTNFQLLAVIEEVASRNERRRLNETMEAPSAPEESIREEVEENENERPEQSPNFDAGDETLQKERPNLFSVSMLVLVPFVLIYSLFNTATSTQSSSDGVEIDAGPGLLSQILSLFLFGIFGCTVFLFSRGFRLIGLLLLSTLGVLLSPILLYLVR